MSPVITSLPVAVIYPHSRCNCRCVMCDIWKRTQGGEISLETFARHLDDLTRLSTRWLVFSGGEPLMHPRLDRMCAMTRERGIRTTILTTGLLLERHSGWIAETVDDLIVSLDGPPAIHDRVRGVPGAFGALARGLRALKRKQPSYSVAGRTTVQRANHDAVCDTAETAWELGLCSISFLAADLASPAFDHGPAWTEERCSGVALDAAETDTLEKEIERLIARWQGAGFVLETPEKLRRIVSLFRARLGLCEPTAPRCNAPWVSAVIETDGTVRPCFFHEAFGRADAHGLQRVLNGPEAVAFRSRLDVATNEICRKCVCSLHVAPGA